MGIFLVRDEYTDPRGADTLFGTTPGPASWPIHIPVALGNAKVLVTTDKTYLPPLAQTRAPHRLGLTSSDDALAGTQARIYTLTDTTWTRSDDPTYLPWNNLSAMATTLTLDGNVVTQADNNTYNVVAISGDTITAHPGPSYAGGFGPLVTRPDAMARFPGANACVAWRFFPASTQVWLDLFGVSGTTIYGKSSISIAGLIPYDAPDSPRQIIPISDSQAISAMVLASGLIKLFHISFTGDLISYQTQDVTGYDYTPDLTLFPSTAHQAEMLVRYNSTSNELRRYGVDFNGTQFILTAMPLTQIPTGATPTDYHPTRSDAGVRPAVDASYLAAGGAIYVARHYVDDGHDDNFIHLTQYDQDTGQIIDSIFTKGDQNGARNDTLYLGPIALAYDETVGELIVATTEAYLPARRRDTPVYTLSSARLGTYRVTYALGESRRSRNASFEP